MSTRIIILISYIGLLTSCDNFLNIVPTGQVVPETVSEYRALMTQAYSIISATNAGITTFRSDEINMAAADSQDRASYLDIWIWNDADHSDTTTPFEWARYYNAIFLVNQIIENEARMIDGTKGEINQLIGEAHMLRAYAHFILVNMYAPPFGANAVNDRAIPIKDNSNTEEVLDRNTVLEVYEFIEDELDNAERRLNIESWELGVNYRFNTLSVDAFRSRLFLYKRDWDASLRASERVLLKKSNLVNMANSDTLPNDYRSSESIVALGYLIPNYVRQRVNMPLINKYTSGDQRRSRYYTAQSPSIYTISKNGSSQFSCAFRTGEIYLNAAEAAYHSSDLEGAKDYLLTLLEHRYNANGFNNAQTQIQAMDAESFIAYLYEERFKELAFEAHRWFDLRRTTQEQLAKTIDDQTYILQQGDSRYTLPIPTEAILSNPNLAN